MLSIVTVFAPLLGFLLAGAFGRIWGDRFAQIITCSLMAISAVAASVTFYDVALQHAPQMIHLASWFKVDGVNLSWGLKIDTLTAVMLIVVTYVSLMVHIYSVGYMSHDKSIARFMCYLSLFTFCMLMLVTAPNFLQMFFGWEGVGLASYLLIGFWYEKDSANAASMKAFLVNRVGDIGFALGIAAIFMCYGALDFESVFAATPHHTQNMFHLFGFTISETTAICLLLFIGAMGKSAQLGLHTWLPDAMEGPTPVSALIHAATMVTAGVFMVARLSPLFEYSETALQVVTIVGATTAIFAATIALTQNDIKRVIAYSTCSQLGYMFFAAGVSGYAASIFHLMTHAFFKALLFLGAGSVIHAMSDEQDMQKMGGVFKMIPVTYAFMWIGNLALAGVPLFAGYYSKDMILEAAFASHNFSGMYAFILGCGAALLTAFYSWRLLYLTFHGKARADEKVMAHVHESPLIMQIPLGILAVGALFAGMIGYSYFVGDLSHAFWGNAIVVLPHHSAMHDAHHVPMLVKIAPVLVGLLGIALATYFYLKNPQLPVQIATRFQSLYLFLYRKWYVDELYNKLFVMPSLALGKVFWKRGDVAIVDRYGPDGLAAATNLFSRLLSRLQTGFIFHYAFAMVVGLVILVSLFFIHVIQSVR